MAGWQGSMTWACGCCVGCPLPKPFSTPHPTSSRPEHLLCPFPPAAPPLPCPHRSQKKRVTSGEALVGHAKALYADEISTGLDSNTTHTIAKSLRNICHVMNVREEAALPGAQPCRCRLPAARLPREGPKKELRPCRPPCPHLPGPTAHLRHFTHRASPCPLPLFLHPCRAPCWWPCCSPPPRHSTCLTTSCCWPAAW